MKQNARDQKRRSAHTITPAWGNPQVAFIIMKERQTPTNLASLSSMGCRGGGGLAVTYIRLTHCWQDGHAEGVVGCCGLWASGLPLLC